MEAVLHHSIASRSADVPRAIPSAPLVIRAPLQAPSLATTSGRLRNAVRELKWQKDCRETDSGGRTARYEKQMVHRRERSFAKSLCDLGVQDYHCSRVLNSNSAVALQAFDT